MTQTGILRFNDRMVLRGKLGKIGFTLDCSCKKIRCFIGDL